ncbi:hypothetical protein QQG74_12225 [Micromonospora sp. FIMYZ51]|uniref:hypothetical protein n=1 Tax=Micromonospora sp. FIMYZ51 TaxID=3051832 RepID=UPI0031201AAE
MAKVVDAVIDTDNGLFLVRDVSADSREALAAAFRARRIPGSRRGRLCVAVGGILVVRGAHQLTRPRVRIEVLATSGPEEPPWHWEEEATMELATGRLVVAADPSFPLDLPTVDLPAGPGRYRVALGHQGRTRLQQEAARVEAETQAATADETHAGWLSLDGIEEYLIRFWPDHR